MTEAIVTGIFVNVVLMFIVKFGAALAHLTCTWVVAFFIAFLITWVGVAIISISDGEIDLW